MNRNKILSSLLAILAMTELTIAALPAHANTPPPWTVSLDANSTSPTDATIESSHNLTISSSSFSIAAIINASFAKQVINVYAWEFSIIYDNSSVNPAGYPPQVTPQFGAQTGPGNPNWAGLISGGTAFDISTIRGVDATHQNLTVYFTLLGSGPGVTVGPLLSPTVQGNLLANVNFTIIHAPASPLTFNITSVLFLDNTLNQLPEINAGTPITENPPRSSGTQNPSTTSTQVINDAIGLAPGGSEVAGSSFHDTATVTGVTGLTPTGSITYEYFATADCSGSFTSQMVTLSGGLASNSPSTGPLPAGSYSYKAVYSGDSNYLGSTSSCEPFTVNKAAPGQGLPGGPIPYIIVAVVTAAILVVVMKRRKASF